MLRDRGTGPLQRGEGVFGLARLIQLVTPQMREQRSGRIINVSSMGGKIYEPLGAWYHATKFAVEGLSDSLRLGLRPFGIDVVIIGPGAIRTEWASIAADKLEQTSGATAYADQARTVGGILRSMDTHPRRATRPVGRREGHRAGRHGEQAADQVRLPLCQLTARLARLTARLAQLTARLAQLANTLRGLRTDWSSPTAIMSANIADPP